MGNLPGSLESAMAVQTLAKKPATARRKCSIGAMDSTYEKDPMVGFHGNGPMAGLLAITRQGS